MAVGAVLLVFLLSNTLYIFPCISQYDFKPYDNIIICQIIDIYSNSMNPYIFTNLLKLGFSIYSTYCTNFTIFLLFLIKQGHFKVIKQYRHMLNNEEKIQINEKI